jgi:hypothetical protein
MKIFTTFDSNENFIMRQNLELISEKNNSITKVAFCLENYVGTRIVSNGIIKLI